MAHKKGKWKHKAKGKTLYESSIYEYKQRGGIVKRDFILTNPNTGKEKTFTSHQDAKDDGFILVKRSM